jgi:hypothetical protein
MNATVTTTRCAEVLADFDRFVALVRRQLAAGQAVRVEFEDSPEEGAQTTRLWMETPTAKQWCVYSMTWVRTSKAGDDLSIKPPQLASPPSAEQASPRRAGRG